MSGRPGGQCAWGRVSNGKSQPKETEGSNCICVWQRPPEDFGLDFESDGEGALQGLEQEEGMVGLTC